MTQARPAPATWMEIMDLCRAIYDRLPGPGERNGCDASVSAAIGEVRGVLRALFEDDPTTRGVAPGIRLHGAADTLKAWQADETGPQEQRPAEASTGDVLPALRSAGRTPKNRDLMPAPAVPAEQASELLRPEFRPYDLGGGHVIQVCMNCGGDATHWDPADGWSCSYCGKGDSDE